MPLSLAKHIRSYETIQSSHQPDKADIIIVIWRWTDWGSERVGDLPKCTQQVPALTLMTSASKSCAFSLSSHSSINQENRLEKHFLTFQMASVLKTAMSSILLTPVGISEDQWWVLLWMPGKGEMHLIKGGWIWFLTLLYLLNYKMGGSQQIISKGPSRSIILWNVVCKWSILTLFIHLTAYPLGEQYSCLLTQAGFLINYSWDWYLMQNFKHRDYRSVLPIMCHSLLIPTGKIHVITIGKSCHYRILSRLQSNVNSA